MRRTEDRHGRRLWLFGQDLGVLPSAGQPDWQAAEPGWIAGALGQALTHPAGGWHVVAAFGALRKKPLAVQVLGRSLVLWRSDAESTAGAV